MTTAPLEDVWDADQTSAAPAHLSLAPELTTEPAPEPTAAVDPQAPLTGEQVLVTGQVPGLSRDAATEAVKRLGGKPAFSVTGKVTLVVAGDGAGVSKMNKVESFSIPIITGGEFADLALDPGLARFILPGRTHAEWVALLDGESEEDGPREPRPGEPDYVAMAQRHLVGSATCYTKVAGIHYRERRNSCQCGHRWVSAISPGTMPTCPVGMGELDMPVTFAPWGLPGYTPGSALGDQLDDRPDDQIFEDTHDAADPSGATDEDADDTSADLANPTPETSTPYSPPDSAEIAEIIATQIADSGDWFDDPDSNPDSDMDDDAVSDPWAAEDQTSVPSPSGYLVGLGA